MVRPPCINAWGASDALWKILTKLSYKLFINMDGTIVNSINTELCLIREINSDASWLIPPGKVICISLPPGSIERYYENQLFSLVSSKLNHQSNMTKGFFPFDSWNTKNLTLKCWVFINNKPILVKLFQKFLVSPSVKRWRQRPYQGQEEGLDILLFFFF